MNKTFLRLLGLVLMAIPMAAQAQVQVKDTSTYNESVIIHGEFTPEISVGEKINVAPALTDTVKQFEHHFNYNLEPFRLTSVYEPSRFKPVRITGEPRTRLYHTYLRLGLGNHWTPLADFYYNSTTSRTLNYGFRVNHRSSWGNIGNENNAAEHYGPAHYSLTDVALFGKKIFKEKWQLSADLAYENDYNLYYGFTDSTLAAHSLLRENLERGDYKAAYNHVAFNVGAKSVQPTQRWGYDVRLHIADLIGAYGQNELNYALDGTLRFRFKKAAIKSPSAALRVQLDGFSQQISDSTLQPLLHASATNPAWQADTTYTTSAARQIITLNPFIDFSLASLQMHGGVRVALDRYNELETLNTYVFPDVTLSGNFMDNALGLTLGAQGDDCAASWDAMRLVNPYVMPGAEVRSQRQNNFYLNLRYNISKKLEINVHGNYAMFKDRLSFVTNEDDYPLGNVFKPKYETGSQITAGGDFSFVNDEMLTLAIGGNYYHLLADDADSLPFLYQAPFDVHFNADVNYDNKVLVHLAFLLLGKMDANYVYNASTEEFDITETLPMRYGLNLEVEYRHNKALSGFVRIDNLLFQRYRYWQNYPSQRGIFTLGLTYTFPTK